MGVRVTLSCVVLLCFAQNQAGLSTEQPEEEAGSGQYQGQGQVAPRRLCSVPNLSIISSASGGFPISPAMATVS